MAVQQEVVQPLTSAATEPWREAANTHPTSRAAVTSSISSAAWLLRRVPSAGLLCFMENDRPVDDSMRPGPAVADAAALVVLPSSCCFSCPQNWSGDTANSSAKTRMLEP